MKQTVQRQLILGTGNRKKAIELTELLAPHGFLLQTLADFSDVLNVVEDGDSFAANAALKATQQAQHLGHWVLGEDSGLVVDALDGRPGIYSARFAGPQATDDENNRLLLEELADVPDHQRTAHYVCHMTLSDPTGQVRIESEAKCHGRIRREFSGSGGFGYDPLFEIIEYHRTFGDLDGVVKQVLSHRARAMHRFLPQLLTLIHRGAWR